MNRTHSAAGVTAGAIRSGQGGFGSASVILTRFRSPTQANAACVGDRKTLGKQALSDPSGHSAVW
jgi:hypothetical protein